jgi:ubiquinone/menaquinone biosynthesis C-methylase UbiE
VLSTGEPMTPLLESDAMKQSVQKTEVAKYWNKRACGTGVTAANKFSRQYFDDIEDYRYRVEPEIFSFAQFTRYRGQRVLEVGVGAGTDFIQWVRAGALAYGIDLTEEGVEHVKHRLNVYGLSAEEVRVADAENIPYKDEFFDLVYSYGVIHHSPDTIRALEELIRCTKVGGSIKFMVYNKYSWNTFYQYLRYGLLKGRPLMSISEVMFKHQESVGTKVYSISEMKRILAKYPVEIQAISAKASNYDLLWNRPKVRRAVASLLVRIVGSGRGGWFLNVEVKKTGPFSRPAESRSLRAYK